MFQHMVTEIFGDLEPVKIYWRRGDITPVAPEAHGPLQEGLWARSMGGRKS